MDWSDEIDARGLKCPFPVLKLRKRLQSAQAGAVIRLLATDPAAVIDVPHYCTESGHELIRTGPAGDDGASGETCREYLVRKTPAA